MGLSAEALRAQLDICIEIHEELSKPYTDMYDVKGMLTQRKKKLRRQWEAAVLRERPDAVTDKQGRLV